MPELCYSFDESHVLPAGWFWSLLPSQLLNYISVHIKCIENNSCLHCVFLLPLPWGCSHKLCNAEEDKEDSKGNCFNKVFISVIVAFWEASLCLCQSLPRCSCDGCALPESCPALVSSWAKPTLFSLGAVAVLSSLLPWDIPQKWIYY